MQRYPDIVSQDEDAYLVLLEAAKQGHLEVFQLFKEFKFKPCFDLLEVAKEHGHEHICKFLQDWSLQVNEIK